MKKDLVCVECPVGCMLSVDIEHCRVGQVSGNKCPKGTAYAVAEVENPQRVLTSCVRAQGLKLAMVPVRTDKPIPKARLLEAMQQVKRIRLKKHVRCGAVIVKNFLGLGVNLISTRSTYGFNPRG